MRNLTISILIMFASCGILRAQEFQFRVNVYTIDGKSNNLRITVKDESGERINSYSTHMGIQEIDFPLDQDYRVTFDCDGYISKTLKIQNKWGYDKNVKYDFDVALSPQISNDLYISYANPVGNMIISKSGNVMVKYDYSIDLKALSRQIRAWEERYTQEF